MTHMPTNAARARAAVLAAFAVLVGAATLLAAACGGSSPEPASGQRVTDPALVPTATPMQNPVLYRFQGNQVILEGGTPAAITPAAGNTPAARKTYTVKSGDTCSAIAIAEGISLDALIKANPTACDNLHVGDTLTIPVPTPTPAGPAGGLTSNPTVRPTPTTPPSSGGTSGSSGKTYTVRSGDTCADIAASYGVSVADLIRVNGLSSDCLLQVGQVVKIP